MPTTTSTTARRERAKRLAHQLSEAGAAAREAGKCFSIGAAADVIVAWEQVEFPATPKKAPIAMNGAATDEEWLCALEAMECYRYIDVRRELGKAQAWGGTNGRPITRRRFVNWLNKADRTVGYDARGKSSADRKLPTSDAPAGWLATLNHLWPSCTMAKGGLFEITKETDYQWSLLDAKMRQEIVKAKPYT